jgi:hypothetical protein
VKNLAMLLVGVVVGWLLGGIPARRAVADLEEQRQALEKDLAAAKKAARRSTRAFAAPFPALGGGAGPAAEEEAARGRGAGDGARVAEVGGTGGGRVGSDSAEIRRGFDLAVDAQRVRARQSRAALVEQAELGEAELRELDGIVEDLNAALAAHAEDVVSWAWEEPGTAEALGVAHDITGILYESQTSLDALIGADRMGNVEEQAQQVWNYVDLEVLRPAVDEMVAAEQERTAPGGGLQVELGDE